MARKSLKTRKGGGKRYDIPHNVPPPDPALIIGFDAEWVTEPPAPTDLDDRAEDDDTPGTLTPDDLPHNRVLSYQWAARYAGREWSGILWTRAGARLRFPGLSEEALQKYPQRWRFADVLGEAIKQGIAARHLKVWPKSIIAAAHWTRADLAAMADYGKIKGEFDAVKNTYVTLGQRPYKARIRQKGRTREFGVVLMDTQLLAPSASHKLDALGKLYGENKLDPGQAPDYTPYITRMDRLITDDPSHYEEYAVKDAQICALHVERMWKFVREDLGLDFKRPPLTLGQITAKHVEMQWTLAGTDPDGVNGREVLPGERYFSQGKWRKTRDLRVPTIAFSKWEALARRCRFGGRNECFWFGPTVNMDPPGGPPYAPVFARWEVPEGRPLSEGYAVLTPVLWREFDLAGAYAVALSSLRVPDYDKARETHDARDFGPDTLGFARVRFQFPIGTMFPCFPVKAPHGRGLIYPRGGEAYVTSPEIAVAQHLGAEIEVLEGVVIPWCADCTPPFADIIRDLTERRAQHSRGTLPNEMFKQIANSIYGKMGQGLAGKKSYNTRTDARDEVGECSLTNVYLAAHVTGLIRALLSEFIGSIRSPWTVISATTDSIITNAPLSAIDHTGPVAQRMMLARMGLVGLKDGAVDLLEQKAEAAQLLPWRTRGIATPSPVQRDKPKLARAGMREPARYRNPIDSNMWFCRTMLTRTPGVRYVSNEPLSFPETHRRSADHVLVDREKNANFEFDMKRSPVFPKEISTTWPWPDNPLPIAFGSEPEPRPLSHLAFATEPWPSLADFEAARDQFDQWRLKHQGQLRTLTDWHRWEEFRSGAAASVAGVRRGRNGLVGQAKQIFIRAYVCRKWGLPGGSYRRAAEALTLAGYRTREQEFKDAARRYKEAPPEHTIAASAPGIADLIQALLGIWPEFEWCRLVHGDFNRAPNPEAAAQTHRQCAGETGMKTAENLESGSTHSEVLV